MQRSKFIFKKIERKVNEEDQIVTCFRDGQVTLRANRRTEGFTNALKEHGYQGIRKGDLVIHAMDAFAGAIGISDSDGKATPVYSVCLPHNKQKIDVYFYSYYLRNLALSGFISSLAKGIRERSTDFRYADFAELLLPIPPYLEQQKIVQFLNDKTAKIDQAVDLAEKQIALLKEHKQILIQNAVTRGLNPDVPLKNSGVEWIGQVPEHWESFRFKRVVEKVKDGTHGTHSRTEQGYPLLSAKNIFNNGIQITDNESLISEYDFKLITSNGFPRKNDLLVTCVGSIGRCCIYPFDEPIAFQRSVAFLRLNKKAFPGFYRYFIESNCYQEQLKTNTKLSIQGGVYLGTLIDLYVCFPPLLEQQTITIYLDTQTAKIDQAIALKTAHIEKLKEYKSVLINDVVTGKVQV
ncbi:restriction endonuclease subunit S [Haemophilus influenzae]